MVERSSSDKLKECYKILNIPVDASIDEIKKKYRLLVRTYHPDVCKNIPPEEASKRIREITEAYKIIMAWKEIEKTLKAKAQDVSHAPSEQRVEQRYDPKVESPSAKVPDGSPGRGLKRKIIYGLVAFSALFLLIHSFVGEPPKTDKPIFVPGKPTTISSDPVQPIRSKPIPKREGLDRTSPEGFFTLGSTENEVLSIQGIPDRKIGQVWHYGLSRVMFNEGRVVGYDNFDGFLKVRFVAKGNLDKVIDYFTLGSSQDEVALVQGTPSKVLKDVWYYGLDRIYFKEKGENKVVSGYDNISGTLKVKIAPNAKEVSVALKRGYFTVGDGEEDVIALQGIPQRVEDNRWFYGTFYVIFDRGRVLNVGPVPGDGGGVLKFLAQQPPNKME
ncbi:MAG: J domain-containing protein [Syntrophobacterales bacterium]|nr:J domain-containing protein [Syntrophobacterales bacterium]